MSPPSPRTLLSSLTTADAQLRALTSAREALALAHGHLTDAGLPGLAYEALALDARCAGRVTLATEERDAAELALRAYRARATGEDCPACTGKGCGACEGTGEHVTPLLGEAVPA